jgi:protein SCO1/2
MSRACRILLALLLAAACGSAPATKQYELKGQILGVNPDRNEMLVKHGDIPGFMPSMTMPYKVGQKELLAGKEPGDLITATLVVSNLEAHLSSVTKTGHVPLDAPDASTVTPGFVMLKEGEEVPDHRLVDEEGAARPLSSLRGHRVALTFMYTRCPLPEFCPLMDRNFVAVQNTIKESPALADVRLVSVSFDPTFDTPGVLKQHARTLHADPAIWHFVTADPDSIKAFAAKFGVVAEQAEGESVITHNLATAVIDPAGRLVTIRSGNHWTPAELVADLKAAPAPVH